MEKAPWTRDFDVSECFDFGRTLFFRTSELAIRQLVLNDQQRRLIVIFTIIAIVLAFIKEPLAMRLYQLHTISLLMLFFYHWIIWLAWILLWYPQVIIVLPFLSESFYISLERATFINVFVFIIVFIPSVIHHYLYAALIPVKLNENGISDGQP